MYLEPAAGYYILNVFVFIFGLCFGSFLNVCICRLPEGESIVFNRSHCPICKTTIRWYENIPLLSWCILKGKCSGCGKGISLRYPFIELLTGLIVLLLWFKVTSDGMPLYMFLFYLNLTFLFIPTFFIDFKHYIIPNKLNLIALIINLILVFLFPEIVGENSRFFGIIISLSGLIVAGGSLYLFNFIGKIFYRKGDLIGLGDIKFMAVIGAAFGICSIDWLAILFIAACLGAILGTLLIFTGRKKWTGVLPFGPFLIIAGYLWIFFGNLYVNVYFSVLQRLLM